jgi:hypothetical protein
MAAAAPAGQLLLRNIAMCFDRYLEAVRLSTGETALPRAV